MSTNKDKEQQIAAHTEAQAQDLLVKSYGENRDLANQLLGQAQMSAGISKLTTVVTLLKMKEVKEGKLYRALKGVSMNSPTGEKIADVGTWEAYCKACGFSKSKVDEDLINLRTFGAEAYQYLNGSGMGYKQLRELRKADSNETKALLADLNQADLDPEEVTQQIEKIKEQHKNDLDMAQLQEKSAKAQLEQSRKLSDKYALEINELKSKLADQSFSPAAWNIKTIQFAEAIAVATTESSKASAQFNNLKQRLFDLIQETESHEQRQLAVATLRTGLSTAVNALAAVYLECAEIYAAFDNLPITTDEAIIKLQEETEALLTGAEDYSQFE